MGNTTPILRILDLLHCRPRAAQILVLRKLRQPIGVSRTTLCSRLQTPRLKVTRRRHTASSIPYNVWNWECQDVNSIFFTSPFSRERKPVSISHPALRLGRNLHIHEYGCCHSHNLQCRYHSMSHPTPKTTFSCPNCRCRGYDMLTLNSSSAQAMHITPGPVPGRLLGCEP